MRAHTLVPILCMLAAASVPAADTHPLDADQLIAHCSRAMSGAVEISRLRTLRIQAVYPDHGDQPIGFEIRRPNQSHSPRSGIAFDGTKACWLRGTDGQSSPELVASEELVDFDVEIGYFFPAFFDFPAEYLGLEELDAKPVHALQVRLPHGAVMVYYLDAATYLPVKATSRFTLRGKAYHFERVYTDYRAADGIIYPHGFTYPGRDGGHLQGRIRSVEVDVPLDDSRFTIPDHAADPDEAR